MVKLCVQGDSLTSRLNNCPCTNHSTPAATSASGDVGNPPAPLPRPQQGAEAGGLIGGQLEARPAEHKCQECGLHFADVSGLKLHQKRVHQMPTLPPAKGGFREHSIDGMPVCRFGRKDLTQFLPTLCRKALLGHVAGSASDPARHVRGPGA